MAAGVLLAGAVAGACTSPIESEGSSRHQTTTEVTTSATPTTSTAASATPTNGSNPGQRSASIELEREGSFRWLELEADLVQFVWLGSDEVPLGQLDAARQHLEDQGMAVVAIANAGIYDETLRPLGLYVENGIELTPINTRSGSGNFYLQPNGVFAVTDSGFNVVSTAEFQHRYQPGPMTMLDPGDERSSELIHAVQSGPMLVVDGEINPLFTPQSQSAKTRTAVGVDQTGRALLLHAYLPVNMWAMANQARKLGLTQVLYLDGTVARFDSVAAGRRVFPNIPLAAMIAVTADAGYESVEQ